MKEILNDMKTNSDLKRKKLFKYKNFIDIANFVQRFFFSEIGYRERLEKKISKIERSEKLFILVRKTA